MKDDTGRIDDASQRVALVLVDFLGNCDMESSEAEVQAGERVFSLGYLPLDAKKHRSRSTNYSAVRFDLDDCGETGAEQEIIERGQQAVQTARTGIGGSVLAVVENRCRDRVPDSVSGRILTCQQDLYQSRAMTISIWPLR